MRDQDLGTVAEGTSNELSVVVFRSTGTPLIGLRDNQNEYMSVLTPAEAKKLGALLRQAATEAKRRPG